MSEHSRPGPLSINWNFLSLVQYLLAILVICLHAGRIFPQDDLHFIQKSLFSRLAVPFFLVSSSFLWAYQMDQQKKSLRQLQGSFIKTYLFWSAIFIPYLLFYLYQQKISLPYWPVAGLIALFYSGSCYHLWYMSAYFWGYQLMTWFQKRWGFILSLGLALILYLFGLLETYSAYTQESLLGQVYARYQEIFWTARNGLFYAPIFIGLGQLAYRHYQKTYLKQSGLYLIFSLLLFGLEGYLIFIKQGIDKNFFLSLLPVTYFFFHWIIKNPFLKNSNLSFQQLKRLSRYYYFIHPIFIELGFLFFPSKNRQDWDKGLLVLSFCLICTHLVSLFIIKQKGSGPKS